MQRLRDNPQCADQERALLSATREQNPGLRCRAEFAVDDLVPAAVTSRPRIAVLREQGVNGQIEMAAAFERAGFEPVDVHMSDLLAGAVRLADFPALVACGGFSYGDVLGGGGGWAKSVLCHERLCDEFSSYFAGSGLVLGVCNGAQMLANLKQLIPGAQDWPLFLRNASEQFEARTVMLRIEPGAPQIWCDGMHDAVIPVAVAHGEGRAEFANDDTAARFAASGQACMRYVDAAFEPTEQYPWNPNGAPQGLAGVSAADGRVLALMPHPERVFLTEQNAWRDPAWGRHAPWMRLFLNARRALG